MIDKENDLDITIERIRRAGRTWRAAIVGATVTVNVAIIASTAYTIAMLPPSPPAAPLPPGEASYRRIVEAIKDLYDRQPGYHDWTPEARAIETKLYDRLVEIDRESGRVEGEVAKAARRIGEKEAAVSN